MAFQKVRASLFSLVKGLVERPDLTLQQERYFYSLSHSGPDSSQFKTFLAGSRKCCHSTTLVYSDQSVISLCLSFSGGHVEVPPPAAGGEQEAGGAD